MPQLHEMGVDSSTPQPPIQVGSQSRDITENETDHDRANLEAIQFDDSPLPDLPASPHDTFVTVTRGSSQTSPFHFPPDTSTPVKNAIADFANSICRVRSPVMLEQQPPRRKARMPSQSPASTIRRSERLAKKSRHRATNPTLHTQNILMKKLGISSASGPLDAAAFEQFLQVFTNTLLVSQCEALDELIPDGRPLFSAAAAEVKP
ncbi:hypothetical protein SEVIR_9G328051v4 [Setaria viridis]